MQIDRAELCRQLDVLSHPWKIMTRHLPYLSHTYVTVHGDLVTDCIGTVVCTQRSSMAITPGFHVYVTPR